MYAGVKDWRDLEFHLNGAFSARARGFLGSKFSLSAKEEGEKEGEFGVLSLGGSTRRVSRSVSRGATFESGALISTIENIENSGLESRMWTAGEQTLSAESGYSGISVRFGGAECEASVSPFRNTASCYSRSGEGRELVRVTGGLMSRNYAASFEAGYLEVAVFLLYYIASMRKKAFRAESAGSEAGSRV